MSKELTWRKTADNECSAIEFEAVSRLHFFKW